MNLDYMLDPPSEPPRVICRECDGENEECFHCCGAEEHFCDDCAKEWEEAEEADNADRMNDDQEK